MAAACIANGGPTLAGPTKAAGIANSGFAMSAQTPRAAFPSAAPLARTQIVLRAGFLAVTGAMLVVWLAAH
jgi:hypothetical protein